jgi:hypothetical protein
MGMCCDPDEPHQIHPSQNEQLARLLKSPYLCRSEASCRIRQPNSVSVGRNRRSLRTLRRAIAIQTSRSNEGGPTSTAPTPSQTRTNSLCPSRRLPAQASWFRFSMINRCQNADAAMSFSTSFLDHNRIQIVEVDLGPRISENACPKRYGIRH